MEEQILKEILQELKGMRHEQVATNQRLESLEATTNKRFESLEATTNKRFESLEATTNKRFEALEQRFDGLYASVQVLTKGVSEVRYELQEVKKLLATRVIWTNDNVSIQVREGETIYGIIRKEERKE